MSVFGVIVLIPFLLFLPGFLICDLTKYEMNSILKKIVVYMATSIASTIIIAVVVSKIQNAVDYNIIILVMSLFTIVLELILGVHIIKINGFVNEFKQMRSSILNYKKEIQRKLNKSAFNKGVILILVLAGMCFPLYIKRDNVPFYSFAFTEFPPITSSNSSVTFEIAIGFKSDINTSLIIQISINETLFFEDEFYMGNDNEKIVRYQTNFTENGHYLIIFTFYEEEDSLLNQIGQLIHWVRIIT